MIPKGVGEQKENIERRFFMKDKPQMIRTSIDSRFIEQYTKAIIREVRIVHDVRLGINTDLFMESGGITEIIFLFLSTDNQAQKIYDFIDRGWEFASPLEFVA